MTRAQFDQLSTAQQIKTLNRYGAFIAERTEAGNRWYLYALNSFYIELFHELSDLNNKGLVITGTFDDTARLDCYTWHTAAHQLQA